MKLLSGQSYESRIRRRFGTVVIATFLATLGLAALPSVAMAGTPAQADLAVTSPPDAVVASPGATASATVTLSNLGDEPLPVSVESRKVELFDNGRTRLTAGTNPEFAGRVSISPMSVTVPARHQVPVQISVSVPANLKPNDYFLGFLVSPIVSGPSTVVENDIGALVILNVPGARPQHLSTSFVGVPALSLSLSSSASGSLVTKNVGAAAVEYATTIETNGTPSAPHSYDTVTPELLPAGLTRTSPVHVDSWLGLGWYTFHATLVYGGEGQTSGEATASHTVIVFNPLWLILPVAIVIGLLWRRRRKQRRVPSRYRHSARKPPQTPSRKQRDRELEPV
jgi:hypothetical protein